MDGDRPGTAHASSVGMATKKMTTKAKKTAKTSSAPKRKQAKKEGGKGLRDLAKMMRGIDLCMMTTSGEDGVLHTRPMSNNGEVDFDGDAWFFTSRDTLKVEDVEHDDRVALSYVGGTKREPVWISVTGSAEIVDDEDKKKELWLKELEQWFENGPEDPNIVLLHVEAAHASWWSGEGQGEVDLA